MTDSKSLNFLKKYASHPNYVTPRVTQFNPVSQSDS